MKKRLPRPLVWIARCLLIAVGAVVLLYLGSNLFLRTKPGKAFVQEQLTRRAPALDWSYRNLSWSPWKGITIESLEARLKDYPEAPPLLELERGVLQVYWSDAIQGRRVLRELSLERPVLHLPIEALLVPVAAPPAPDPVVPTPTPPSAKQAEGAAPDSASRNDSPPSPPKAEKPKPAQTDGSSTAQDLTKKEPAAQPPASPPSENQPPPPEDPRFWLRMRDAEVRLYSLTGSYTAAVRGLDADLPLSGPPVQGSIRWSEVTLLGKKVIARTKLPVAWKNPAWVVEKNTLPLTKAGDAEGQFDLEVDGKLAVRAPGKPFSLRAYFPPQSLPEQVLHPESGLSLAFEDATASLRASGSLANPLTWQLDHQAIAKQVQIFSQRRGEHYTFETARARTFLRQGILYAPDLRLRSERHSLMANGQLSLTGSVLGVVRVVVSPEIEEGLTRIAIGSLLSQGHTSHWFLPLGTPDRYYRDFHIEGILPDPQINLGRRYEFMKLSQALEIMKPFYRRELAEEPPVTP